jgi:peptidoglycan/xylan/chitin deacetylase (PgdA/CDA1 family)
MTVGLEDFERQIRFLKKHYNILHPAELYGWLHGRDGAKGEKAVLITFDDGYEDNYLNALPILKKYDCPAIFFISTGLIGNDVQFGHEKQIQPNLEFKKMTWEQLKDATQYNIEIGVHSDTHANLGQISFEEAVGEIERSIQKCEYYLGRKPTIMSYPFGGKENISLKVIDYIKHGGVITNLFSAYGNKNISPFNDFDIKRINVGSNDNKQWIFRFNLEGGFRTIFYPRESL